MRNIILLSLFLFCCIAAAAPATYDNFWSAARAGDRVAILRIASNQEPEILVMPASAPLEKSDTVERLPRIPGDYLLFLRDGRALAAKTLPPRCFDEAAGRDLAERYRSLAPEAEAAFLLDRLEDSGVADWSYDSLRRLQELGWFQRPLAHADLERMLKIYRQNHLKTPEKRMILENLARFHSASMEPLFQEALQDEQLWCAAGQIWQQHDPRRFSAVTQKMLQDDRQWPMAIRQSELFCRNPEFIRAALARYDFKNPAGNPNEFIPLLFFTDALNKHRCQAAIKALLNAPPEQGNFKRWLLLGRWLNRTHAGAEPFRAEITTFLSNHASLDEVKAGIVYPSMLAVLYKIDDPAGIRMSLEYLKDLRKRSAPALAEQVCLLFRQPGQPNPTLDEVIAAVSVKSAGLTGK